MASAFLGDCSTSSTARLLHLQFCSASLLPLHRLGPLSLPRTMGFSRTPIPLRALSAASASTSPKPSATAGVIIEEVPAEVARMKKAIGVVPGLVAILVGDRTESATYVPNKKKAGLWACWNKFL